MISTQKMVFGWIGLMVVSWLLFLGALASLIHLIKAVQ